jgi:uncharacterized protein
MDQPLIIPTLPMPLHWQPPPLHFQLTDSGGLTATAGARTDLFADPGGSAEVHNAPSLTGRADGDFQLAARVSVEHAATFDAGALLLRAHEHAWAKLCLERSPQGQATVVSVVTRGRSDDCNSFVVEGSRAWLRVSRLGPAFAFHASVDGADWRLIRYFALEDAGEVEVGFLAQSPTGDGCTATFDQISYIPARLTDLRDGT